SRPRCPASQPPIMPADTFILLRSDVRAGKEDSMDWKRIARIGAGCMMISVFPGAGGCMLSGGSDASGGGPDGGARVRLVLSPAALARGAVEAPAEIDSAHI